MLNWLKKLKVSGKRRRSGTSASEPKETGTEPNNTQPVETTEQKPRKSKKANQKQDPRAGKTSRKKSRDKLDNAEIQSGNPQNAGEIEILTQIENGLPDTKHENNDVALPSPKELLELDNSVEERREEASAQEEDQSSTSEDDYVVDFDFNDRIDDEVDFSCLSPEEIVTEQSRQIKSVAEILDIVDAVAGNLLRHYRWKKEVLLTKYFEDPAQVWKESGIPKPEKPKKAKTKRSKSKKLNASGSGSKIGMCSICGDEKDFASECTALSCEHCFCNECWDGYLTMKIQEGQVNKITCPAVSCKVLIGEEQVKKLVVGDVYDKYVRFITKSFVEDNSQVSWCPAPGCGNAITADMISGKVVKCTCGYRFCFTCHREAHAPVTCQQVAEWERKCKDDSETSHWIGANTKECPKCSVSVEKNGGCNHMVCRQCTYEWCWLCNKPWKGHNDFYTCNRYAKTQKKLNAANKKKKKSKIIKEEEEREQKRIALERYLHYFERFVNHDNASKLEKQTKEKAYKKMEALQSEESTRAEVQFIEKGTNVLLECHNALKYSYVYAYFLSEDAPEKPLFNFFQEELEKTTEQLAEILESPSTMMRKTEAVDVTKLAKLKRDNLLNGVENAFVNTKIAVQLAEDSS
jgi:ariadne-1